MDDMEKRADDIEQRAFSRLSKAMERIIANEKRRDPDTSAEVVLASIAKAMGGALAFEFAVQRKHGAIRGAKKARPAFDELIEMAKSDGYRWLEGLANLDRKVSRSKAKVGPAPVQDRLNSSQYAGMVPAPRCAAFYAG